MVLFALSMKDSSALEDQQHFIGMEINYLTRKGENSAWVHRSTLEKDYPAQVTLKLRVKSHFHTTAQSTLQSVIFALLLHKSKPSYARLMTSKLHQTDPQRQRPLLLESDDCALFAFVLRGFGYFFRVYCSHFNRPEKRMLVPGDHKASGILLFEIA